MWSNVNIFSQAHFVTCLIVIQTFLCSDFLHLLALTWQATFRRRPKWHRNDRCAWSTPYRNINIYDAAKHALVAKYMWYTSIPACKRAYVQNWTLFQERHFCVDQTVKCAYLSWYWIKIWMMYTYLISFKIWFSRRGIHRWPVTQKIFPFDDVIMRCAESVCGHVSGFF